MIVKNFSNLFPLNWILKCQTSFLCQAFHSKFEKGEDLKMIITFWDVNAFSLDVTVVVFCLNVSNQQLTT